MSEQEKSKIEGMVEAANRGPAEMLPRVLGYVEGYADGMEASRREKDSVCRQ